MGRRVDGGGGIFCAVGSHLIVQAAVFAVASFGFALHWSCLIVAAVLAAVGAAAFVKGRADASEDLTPNRTIHQVKQDIAIAKEQL